MSPEADITSDEALTVAFAIATPPQMAATLANHPAPVGPGALSRMATQPGA
jgi:hypothetical protein